jgi:glucose dehydrogenase
MPGTYDPQLSTVFWGTSNPAPDFEGSGRPGDDLYTDCVVALDADSGKLKWYFQFTPHDLFDYDAVETPMLIDAPYRSQERKLLVQANRNGYLYVIDRTDGKFLFATPFVEKLNWATGNFPKVGRGHSSGGTMTTGSALVFFGDDAESFEAVDAQNGRPLWHFNAGQDMSASPMSYAIQGKLYGAIAAGSDVFSFALP